MQFTPKLWEAVEGTHRHRDRGDAADPVFSLGKGVTRMDQGSTRQKFHQFWRGDRCLLFLRWTWLTIGCVSGSGVVKTFMGDSDYFKGKQSLPMKHPECSASDFLETAHGAGISRQSMVAGDKEGGMQPPAKQGTTKQVNAPDRFASHIWQVVGPAVAASSHEFRG